MRITLLLGFIGFLMAEKSYRGFPSHKFKTLISSKVRRAKATAAPYVPPLSYVQVANLNSCSKGASPENIEWYRTETCSYLPSLDPTGNTPYAIVHVYDPSRDPILPNVAGLPPGSDTVVVFQFNDGSCNSTQTVNGISDNSTVWSFQKTSCYLTADGTAQFFKVVTNVPANITYDGDVVTGFDNSKCSGNPVYQQWSPRSWGVCVDYSGNDGTPNVQAKETCTFSNNQWQPMTNFYNIDSGCTGAIVNQGPDGAYSPGCVLATSPWAPVEALPKLAYALNSCAIGNKPPSL